MRTSASPPFVPAPSAAISLGASAAAGWWLLAAWVAIAIVWDVGGGDHALARAMGGGATGFALRDHWFLTQVLHAGGRILSWGLAVALLVGIWWPWGPLRRIDRAARVQWLAGTLVAVALVSLVKSRNPAACPWDLVAFGGAEPEVSHWAWFSAQARGHCFPAGHASSGFGFLGAWCVFRPVSPRLARHWLVGVVLAGLLVGLGQQWRGAHFMSHTLWTAVLCLLVALLADWLRHRLAPLPAPALAPSPVATTGSEAA